MNFITKLLKKRKSSFDVDNGVNIISGVMFAGILLAVLLLVITIIFGLGVFGDNNLSDNVTAIEGNIVGMVINFFALMPTVGTILAVVILIAVIVLLVMYVSRMKGIGSTSATSGTFQG